jgi:hypothetical protein
VAEVKVLKALGRGPEAQVTTSGHPLPDATLALAKRADAVIVGAAAVLIQIQSGDWGCGR